MRNGEPRNMIDFHLFWVRLKHYIRTLLHRYEKPLFVKTQEMHNAYNDKEYGSKLEKSRSFEEINLHFQRFKRQHPQPKSRMFKPRTAHERKLWQLDKNPEEDD